MAYVTGDNIDIIQECGQDLKKATGQLAFLRTNRSQGMVPFRMVVVARYKGESWHIPK